jgi:hypothetical protein
MGEDISGQSPPPDLTEDSLLKQALPAHQSDFISDYSSCSDIPMRKESEIPSPRDHPEFFGSVLSSDSIKAYVVRDSIRHQEYLLKLQNEADELRELMKSRAKEFREEASQYIEATTRLSQDLVCSRTHLGGAFSSVSTVNASPISPTLRNSHDGQSIEQLREMQYELLKIRRSLSNNEHMLRRREEENSELKEVVNRLEQFLNVKHSTAESLHVDVVRSM